MNNQGYLKSSAIALRLRQVALACLALGKTNGVKLCVDTGESSENEIKFFVRTSQGKPDRTDKRIEEIVAAASESYGSKVIAQGGALTLPGEKETANESIARIKELEEVSAIQILYLDDSRKSVRKAAQNRIDELANTED